MIRFIKRCFWRATLCQAEEHAELCCIQQIPIQLERRKARYELAWGKFTATTRPMTKEEQDVTDLFFDSLFK